VTLQVNGAAKSLNIDARTTLLDALREHIGLTGSKKVAITASVGLAPSWSAVAAYFPA
jgi:aerobic-type carbon monoxide dehydrogenase small subunit (CoxS/CutS family)